MEKKLIISHATLEELDGERWGDSDYGSFLVTQCLRLRQVQLHLLTVENLRMLIGQSIGLPFLLPWAIEHLQRDPLIAGDFYRGDLLAAMLRIKPSFWSAHPQLRAHVEAVAGQARQALTSEEDVPRDVLVALEDFLGTRAS